jgi:hypothetical protein
MNLEHKKYSKVDQNKDNAWLGPCEDSFCYARCDFAHCRREFRLGKSPSEHNEQYDKLVQKELNEMKEAIKEIEDVLLK